MDVRVLPVVNPQYPRFGYSIICAIGSRPAWRPRRHLGLAPMRLAVRAMMFDAAVCGYGTIVVVSPGSTMLITPAHMHMQVETLSSAG
jgi:hypothetical protein